MTKNILAIAIVLICAGLVGYIAISDPAVDQTTITKTVPAAQLSQQ